MKWPWQRREVAQDTLAFSLGRDGLHWLVATPGPAHHRLLRAGTLPLLDNGLPDPVAARALAQGIGSAICLLPLHSYQLLQIEAPAVPVTELRSAVRWQIREQVERHLDDLTLDVLRVGRPQAASASTANGQLFVVAASNTDIAQVSELARDAGWPLTVIDTVGLAQRNLHAATAHHADLAERATACLTRQGPTCLLTIVIGDELYYSRRLEWSEQLVAIAVRQQVPEAASSLAMIESAVDANTLSNPFSLEAPLGAPVELGAQSDEETSSLVVELQRSFDVWERSWLDWPLAALWLDLALDEPGEHTAIASYLESLLGLRVLLQDATASFDSEALAEPLPSACRPLLGALLRTAPPAEL